MNNYYSYALIFNSVLYWTIQLETHQWTVISNQEFIRLKMYIMFGIRYQDKVCVQNRNNTYFVENRIAHFNGGIEIKRSDRAFILVGY